MKPHALAPVAAMLVVACSQSSQTPAANISREQFKQLEWLAGTWRGSGGGYQAFFEEYRFVNDTTIRMRAFADSTLSKTTDSSVIQWVNSTIRSGHDRPQYVVIEFTPTSVQFREPGASAGGHTFRRVSADEWTATLHAGRPGGQETVYVMRRIGPA